MVGFSYFHQLVIWSNKPGITNLWPTGCRQPQALFWWPVQHLCIIQCLKTVHGFPSHQSSHPSLLLTLATLLSCRFRLVPEFVAPVSPSGSMLHSGPQGTLPPRLYLCGPHFMPSIFWGLLAEVGIFIHYPAHMYSLAPAMCPSCAWDCEYSAECDTEETCSLWGLEREFVQKVVVAAW